MEKPKLLSDEELNKAWDGAFDTPMNFDHKPLPEDLFIVRLRAIAKAQLAKDVEIKEA